MVHYAGHGSGGSVLKLAKADQGQNERMQIFKRPSSSLIVCRSRTSKQAIRGALYIHESPGGLAQLAKGLKAWSSKDAFSGKEIHWLSGEADIVRASSNQLVHPVNMMLPESFPGPQFAAIAESSHATRGSLTKHD